MTILLLSRKISELKVFNPAVTNLYKGSSSVPASTDNKTEGRPGPTLGECDETLFAIRLQLVVSFIVSLVSVVTINWYFRRLSKVLIWCSFTLIDSSNVSLVLGSRKLHHSPAVWLCSSNETSRASLIGSQRSLAILLSGWIGSPGKLWNWIATHMKDDVCCSWTISSNRQVHFTVDPHQHLRLPLHFHGRYFNSCSQPGNHTLS